MFIRASSSAGLVGRQPPPSQRRPGWTISWQFKASALEPVGLVDDVAEGLTREEAAAVVEEDLAAAVVEVGAVTGGVRGDQHVGRGPERVIRGQGLLLEDVEGRARDLAGPERGHQVVEA